MGAINDAQADLGASLAGTDLVFVALPVGLTIERLPEIARLAPPAALVTDAASTKRQVCEVAENCFSGGAAFSGGHPMAGQERSGIEAADAALFRGAKYALVGKSEGSGARVQAPADARVTKFLSLLESIGARPLWMDASTRDRAAAVVSAPPQLLAIALVAASCIGRRTRRACRSRWPAAACATRCASPAALTPSGATSCSPIAKTSKRLWTGWSEIEHLRAHLRRRELEGEFAAANEVYKILRDLQ